MLKTILAFLLLVIAFPLSAQELNGRVEVSYDRIQGVDAKVFQTLQKSLNDFVNNRKWTDDNFKPNEKINCDFLLYLTRKESENVYSATLTIQASRPVFNSSYSTPTVNYQDKEIVFRFNESQTLQFSDNSVSGSDALASNLTAVFAYYVYIIIGLDYDSFSPDGGSPYFKKAQNIVNNAPEEGKTITGWKSSEGRRNRYWLIEQILNPRFSAFRSFWYTYHRKGLDMMEQSPDPAMKNIFGGLPVLAKLNDENTASILLQFYFNAKSDEWASLLQQAPRQDRKAYIDQLMKMDVTDADKYRRVK
jgi:hypothetical protein